MLTGDFGAIFSALSSGGVRYLVVGGKDLEDIAELRAIEELRDGG